MMDVDRFAPARLSWREGLPYSESFGDTYFSVYDPQGERRHVFFAGNQLPERWLDLDFAIGDLGFGTGLNLLLLMDHYATSPWRSMSYVTWERHPFLVEDLCQIHRIWPDLMPHANRLAEVYPPTRPGVHRVSLDEYALELSFVFDDVAKGLAAAPRPLDAWFLDGFAPSQNPEMWRDELFAEVAAQTALGGTFATYSAAGHVRRGLRAVGFDVERAPGFKGKRHMSRGRFRGISACSERQLSARADGDRPPPGGAD